MKHLGDYDASSVIYGKFTTYRPSTGAAFTLGGTPALSVYKDNSATQSTTGVTLTADFDSVTGLNHFAIDTSADGTFYSAGSNFDVVITTGTVDSVSVVGSVVASFTIRKSAALKSTTAGRTLDVTATGEAGLDFANIGAPAAGAVPVLGMIDNGTAQSATGTTLVLRAAAAFATSELIGAVIVITGGTTGVGQVRQITAYNGGTDTATVETWTTTPTGTITYAIFAAPPASATPPSVNVTQWLGSAVATPTVAGVPEVDVTHVGGTAQTAGDIIADTNDIQSRLPAALVSGRIDASVGAMAANVITAAATATDFGAEIADAVWDELLSGHVGAGSAGEALAAAGTAGDPWTTALPGAYGAGTAGYLIGTNLDAQVSTIKSKTDNLPTDPADESLIIAATDAIMTRLGAPAGASVSADVAAVKSDTAAVKTKTDFLPSATAGSAGGLVIDGVNSGAASFTAGLTISNTAGSALTLNSSGGNGSGLDASGSGTGDGIQASGGATGRGLHARGGATSGAGVLAEARADNSNGISATGFGSGDGLMTTGGPTGHGIHGVGGSSSGAGIVAEGVAGNANGLECIANGTGIDLAADNIAAILATTDKLDTTVQAQSGLVSGYRFTAEALSLAPSGSGPTVAQIVDGVWDEPISGHLTSGSTGAALNGAGAAGDPWTTPLPGAYGAGTAGFIVGTNVDAAVSAVKAKTDNLPTDPADESLVIAATDAIFNRIGAPAGASVSADVAAVNAKTTNLPTDPADESLIIAATDAIMARLGLPAGVSVSADVAAVLASVGLRLLTSAYTAPLDAAGTRTAVGLASANLDTQLGTLATAAALATTDGKATAIQAKTDSLAFTVAGQVDANVQYVNDAQVTGNGQPGTEWGPV